MNLTKATAVTGIRKNKAGKVTAFNINRKVWGRGQRGGFLLNVKELADSVQINMCCLGIYARACGVGVKRLKNLAMPSSISGKVPKSLGVFLEPNKHIGIEDTNLASDLASYNDSSDLSDEVREQRIIEGFAEVGIKVRFVGKG
jgi:hypothetical protein